MIRLDELVTHDSGVLVPANEGTAATYLDGAEQYLLDALRSCGDVSVFSPELRTHVRDWASLYHLTPYRATIFDALGLAGDARVLELGAGCGAVTRWLGEHFDSVDAVEGSLARARVARERCRDLENVRVAAANFFDLDFGAAYDIATLIGVLEYSHLYHPELGDDPAGAARSNLELARRSLAADGMVVIAIENKLGLKYLGGSHEDHAARRFEGIEGYPSRRSAVTYSAAELERLVLAAGVTAVDFYLPFPDYKLARTVFDAKLTDESAFPANWIETPFPDRAGPQAQAPFNESLALRELVAGGLLRDLSNSFLVLAYNGDRETARKRLGVEGDWVARHYSLDRAPGFCKRTSLEPADSGLVVRNIAAAPTEPPTGLGLSQRLEDEPFRPGHQLLFTLHEHAAAGRLERELPALVARLHGDFLVSEYGTGRIDSAGLPLLDGASIDATPWNIVVEPGTGAWTTIDREWSFDGVLPVDYVLWRGLHHAAARHHGLARARTTRPGSRSAAFERSSRPSTPDRASLYEQLEAYMQRAAGAEPGPVPRDHAEDARAHHSGGQRSAGRRLPSLLAFAEELIETPELVADLTRGLRRRARHPRRLRPRRRSRRARARGSKPLLATSIGGLDVVLLALPGKPRADERRLARPVDRAALPARPPRPASRAPACRQRRTRRATRPGVPRRGAAAHARAFGPGAARLDRDPRLQPPRADKEMPRDDPHGDRRNGSRGDRDRQRLDRRHRGIPPGRAGCRPDALRDQRREPGLRRSVQPGRRPRARGVHRAPEQRHDPATRLAFGPPRDHGRRDDRRSRKPADLPRRDDPACGDRLERTTAGSTTSTAASTATTPLSSCRATSRR